MKKRSLEYVFLSVLTVYLCVMLYLFALNGRYQSVGDRHIVLDKWKKEIISPGTDELPIVRNGDISK